MKKILIATRNKDKFKIVSKLLKSSVFNNYAFFSLSDIEEKIIDKKEKGDLINRSFEKALNVYDSLKTNDFDFIVGVDDGIKIKGKIIENVKDYIKPIINDELLSENEVVYIVRAYTFINNKGKKHSFLTEIPFKYLKDSCNITLEENSYPLSYVLAPLEFDKKVVELSDDESNDYYLKYSIDKFKEVIEKYNA